MKRVEVWDARRWALVAVLVAVLVSALLSLASGLVVALARR